MRKLLMSAAVLTALVAPAMADTYHYACKKGDTPYALTVNTDKNIVKLLQRAPTKPITTFKILKAPSDCSKYGWTLDDGAIFCTATQGYADLHWRGQKYECNQADTD